MSATSEHHAGPAPRPPRAHVISLDDAAAYLAPVDWSDWYLTDEEDMGESPEQHECILLLQPSLQRLVLERGWQDDVYVGGDAFFGWMPAEPDVRLSPDIYLMPRPPAGPLPRMWCTWKEGQRPPRLAIEVVSDSWRKDYRVNPQKYAALGVEELVVFDPGATSGHAIRVTLQVYRRTEDGLFVAAYIGQGPVRSEVLDAWFVVLDTPEGPRARLSRDPEGLQLIPTHLELAEQERERAEQERERAEQERERAEQERERAEQERERAEQERERAEEATRRLAELEARLAQLEATDT